jgi:anti-sigma factor RsiW
MRSDHDRYEQDAGAYLLGALPALEAEVFERHLMGCDTCRDEIARLRPAAEALPRAVDSFEPPASLKASLMEIVESEAGVRREPARPAAPEPASNRPGWLARGLAGLRPRPALALATVALLMGVALGFGLIEGRGSGDGTHEVTASVDRTRLPGGSARLEVADGQDRPATLRVTGVPMPEHGEVYEVWVERDGEVRPAGALFAVSRDGRGTAAIPGGVEGVDRVMVTREHAGGADHPTETPVISAEV